MEFYGRFITDCICRKGLRWKTGMICLRCGRKLKSVISMEAGYGSVCYKRKFGIAPHASRRDADVLVPAEEADHNLPGQISMEDYLQTLLRQ